MPTQTLPRPANLDEDTGSRGPSMWIDEAIWGHRLYDEQTPWLAFLEFLNVLHSEYAAGRAFQEVEGVNTLRYSPAKRLYLRNVLFNNPRLLAIQRDVPDDAARWAKWIADMKSSAHGVREADFGYIRERFETFDDFCLVVQLLRQTAIEGESNKRWTSKFVFPYGPAALYEDLNVKPNSITNDRRFFGRVGELVYLMLCRSGRREDLLSSLEPLVLAENSRWNRLIRALSPSESEAPTVRAKAYLPYESLDEFTAFAEDWLAVLRCQMPGYDAIPHLVDLLGLHIVSYLLRRAADWAPLGDPVHFVLEVIAPRRTTIRDLAADNYLANNQRPKDAVEAYIRESVERSPRWQSAIASTDPFGDGKEALWELVFWSADDEYEGPESADVLLKHLRNAALRRHSQHLANVHGKYMREIGLATRRASRRMRYAPNDQILKTLVVANVAKRMEFQEFLHVLHQRYGMVIGHHQATAYIDRGVCDQKTFEDNAKRLEQRLASLGLLRRLSDACAYIENPFYMRG